MSGSNENILRRKVRAAEARQVEVLEKVSERTSRSQSSTILAMTSIIFGIVKFDDDVELCGFDASFIDIAIKNLVGGTTRDDAERTVTKTDAATFDLIINKIPTQALGPILSKNNGILIQGYELEKAQLEFLLAERYYALLRVHIDDIKGTNLYCSNWPSPLAASKKSRLWKPIIRFNPRKKSGCNSC